MTWVQSRDFEPKEDDQGGSLLPSKGNRLPGIWNGSPAWGDYDGDGRLNFLPTGYGAGQLWRNNMPVASNTPPAAPTGFSAPLFGATASLSWNPPATELTPSRA